MWPVETSWYIAAGQSLNISVCLRYRNSQHVPSIHFQGASNSHTTKKFRKLYLELHMILSFEQLYQSSQNRDATRAHQGSGRLVCMCMLCYRFKAFFLNAYASRSYSIWSSQYIIHSRRFVQLVCAILWIHMGAVGWKGLSSNLMS